MSSSKFTTFGFQQWMLSHDDDLFANMVLPEGIDKETLTDNIILRGGEFEVVYSNPDFYKAAIGVWSKKYQRTFEKWINALNISYNPLENYDRMEEWSDRETGTQTDTENSYSSGETRGSTSTNSSTEEKKSAFDSSTYQPQSTVDGSGIGTDESYNSSESNNNHNMTNSHDLERTGRAHGNIGVTTSQQMLQSELDISKWNIYEQITDLFINEFCIMVYV